MTTVRAFRNIIPVISLVALAGCLGGASGGVAPGMIPPPAAGAGSGTGAGPGSGPGKLVFPNETETAAPSHAAPIDMARRNALVAEHGRIEQKFYMWPAMRSYVDKVAGKATFNGVAAMGSQDEFVRYPVGGSRNELNAELVAAMALTVDFDKEQVNGVMWDFHNKEGERAG